MTGSTAGSTAGGTKEDARLVFITGASSGIGQALSLHYHRSGHRLALVARNAAALQAWAAEQSLAPERVAVYGADVRDIDAITAAGRACIAAQGLPDVVIANAGISMGIDSAEFEDLAVLRATLETNQLGLAATFQPFITPMRTRRSGRLVGIGSVAGIRGLPGHAAYCSSKAAVIAYCESLRGELRAEGVEVVTLCPGYVDTPLTRANPYGMPFLLTAERFAELAVGAIERGVSYRVIPWQMGVASRIMRMLPNGLFDRLLVGRARKPRANG